MKVGRDNRGKVVSFFRNNYKGHMYKNKGGVETGEGGGDGWVGGKGWGCLLYTSDAADDCWSV